MFIALSSIAGSISGFFSQDTAVSYNLLEKVTSQQRVTGFQYQQESKKSKGITKKVSKGFHCMRIQEDVVHIKG